MYTSGDQYDSCDVCQPLCISEEIEIVRQQTADLREKVKFLEEHLNEGGDPSSANLNSPCKLKGCADKMYPCGYCNGSQYSPGPPGYGPPPGTPPSSLAGGPPGSPAGGPPGMEQGPPEGPLSLPHSLSRDPRIPNPNNAGNANSQGDCKEIMQLCMTLVRDLRDARSELATIVTKCLEGHSLGGDQKPPICPIDNKMGDEHKSNRSSEDKRSNRSADDKDKEKEKDKDKDKDRDKDKERRGSKNSSKEGRRSSSHQSVEKKSSKDDKPGREDRGSKAEKEAASNDDDNKCPAKAIMALMNLLEALQGPEEEEPDDHDGGICAFIEKKIKSNKCKCIVKEKKKSKKKKPKKEDTCCCSKPVLPRCACAQGQSASATPSPESPSPAPVPAPPPGESCVCICNSPTAPGAGIAHPKPGTGDQATKTEETPPAAAASTQEDDTKVEAKPEDAKPEPPKTKKQLQAEKAAALKRTKEREKELAKEKAEANKRTKEREKELAKEKAEETKRTKERGKELAKEKAKEKEADKGEDKKQSKQAEGDIQKDKGKHSDTNIFNAKDEDAPRKSDESEPATMAPSGEGAGGGPIATSSTKSLSYGGCCCNGERTQFCSCGPFPEPPCGKNIMVVTKKCTNKTPKPAKDKAKCQKRPCFHTWPERTKCNRQRTDRTCS